mmetsp:Transcript_36423/g.70264  ORF Transcript_36423/g.70264 Transcript_36423/m.70264 type:complete len:89 (+) Transcript_36423:1128-1394(+)
MMKFEELKRVPIMLLLNTTDGFDRKIKEKRPWAPGFDWINSSNFKDATRHLTREFFHLDKEYLDSKITRVRARLDHMRTRHRRNGAAL